MSKMEMIKKLEHMVAFQCVCLAEGNWEEYDYAANRVVDLEKEILAWGSQNQ